MKFIEESVLRRLVPAIDIASSTALMVESAELVSGNLPVHIHALSNVFLLSLFNNKISSSSAGELWCPFPSVWWVNLSRNLITKLSDLQLPCALGSLDLLCNDIDLSELSAISSTHLLRLNLPLPSSEDGMSSSYRATLCHIISALPYCWVINGHFATRQDRDYAKLSNAGPEQAPSSGAEGGKWRRTRSGRESSILRVINSLAKQGPDSDIRRLDILLEDYMHEVYYHNLYVKETRRKGGCPHISPMPYLDLTPLLSLPHRLKLDLSVMLSASLLFDIPHALLVDALQRHLGMHWSTGAGGVGADKHKKEMKGGGGLDSVPHLPPFVRTALVCLLRRLAKKEREEMERWERILTPPALAGLGVGTDGQIPCLTPPCSFEGYEDMGQFVFLRNVLIHLESTMSSLTSPSLTSPNIPFTPLEEEVLSTLPDIMCLFKHGKFVSFMCRHTILLLQQSPLCPPLTRLPTNATQQSTYFSLLPLLKGAGMTLLDLDLLPADLGGRKGKGQDGLDFRPLLPDLVANPNGNGKALREERRARDILAGRYLPWGVGLPRASPLSLSWKEEGGVSRTYPRPWLPGGSNEVEVEVEAEKEEDGGEFFVTEGEGTGKEINLQSPPPKSPPPRTPVYRLSSDTSLFLHSHSLGEGLPVLPNAVHSPPLSPTVALPMPRSTSSPSSLRRSSSSPPQSHSHKPAKPTHVRSSPSLLPERGMEAAGDSLSLCRSLSISLPSVDARETEEEGERGVRLGMDISPPPTPPTAQSAFPSPPRSSQSRDRQQTTQTQAKAPARVSTPTSTPTPALLSPNPVTGYSGDFLWGARFLLAPAQPVGERVGMAEDGVVWRPLSSPPVVVIDPPPFAKRIEKAIHTPAVVLERVSEQNASVGKYEARKSEETLMQGVVGVKAGVNTRDVKAETGKGEDTTDVMSIDDSIAFSDYLSIDGGRRQSKNIVDRMINPEDTGADVGVLDVGFTPQEGYGENKHGERGSEGPRRERKGRINSADVGYGNEESLQAAQFALLKSLGTIKNMRSLNSFNSKVKKLKLGDVKKAGGVARLGGVSMSNLGYNTIGERKLKERQEVVKGDGDEGFFLTHVHQSTDDPGDGESLVSSQHDLDEAPSPHHYDSRPARSYSPPRAVLLRSLMNYEGIYEGTGGVPAHPREVTISGKVLHPSFHPVYPNPPLAMDPAHAIPPQQGLQAVTGIEDTAIRISQRGNKRLGEARMGLSKSLGALQIAVKEPNKSFGVKGAGQYPVVYTHNLDVINSNPLLSSLLTKTLPPSLARTLSQPPLSMPLVAQDSVGSARSSSIVSNSNSTFQETAIYEAYSPQVLSSSQVDGPPSLANLQYSLTYSPRRIGTVGSSSAYGGLQPEGSASQSFPQMPSLKLPRSQPPQPSSVLLSPLAVAPSSQSQWTGSHKGATHKLALN
eukprot:gene27228-32895_t